MKTSVLAVASFASLNKLKQSWVKPLLLTCSWAGSGNFMSAEDQKPPTEPPKKELAKEVSAVGTTPKKLANSTSDERPPALDTSDSQRLRFWVPVHQLDSQPIESEHAFSGKLNDLVDYTHDRVGSGFVRTTSWFDHYFDNNNDDYERENFSYLKLRTGLGWAQSEGIEPVLRIRAKADLPYLKHRFKLVLTSASEQFFKRELNGTEDNFRVNENLRNNDHSFSTALRWTALQVRRHILNFDVGVKATFPVEIFAKAHYEYLYPINSVWDFNWRERLYAVINDESGSTTNFDFNRKIGKSRVLGINQQIHFTDESEGVEWMHGYSFYQLFSHARALSLSCAVSGHTDPTIENTNYGIGVQYRQPVFRKWITMFIEPEIHYPRSEFWKPQHQITVGLDSLFGNPKSYY